MVPPGIVLLIVEQDAVQLNAADGHYGSSCVECYESCNCFDSDDCYDICDRAPRLVVAVALYKRG